MKVDHQSALARSRLQNLSKLNITNNFLHVLLVEIIMSFISNTSWHGSWRQAKAKVFAKDSATNTRHYKNLNNSSCETKTNINKEKKKSIAASLQDFNVTFFEMQKLYSKAPKLK